AFLCAGFGDAKETQSFGSGGSRAIDCCVGQNFGPRLVLTSPAPVGAPPLGRGALSHGTSRSVRTSWVAHTGWRLVVALSDWELGVSEWLDLKIPWWEIVLRASIVYFVLLALLRVSGKRTVGQFTPFDLLVLVLLGDAVQGSMIAGDESLQGGLILAFTLLAWNRLVGFVTARSELVALVVEGKEDILARNGTVFEEALKKADLTRDDLQEAMRDHSVPSINKIRLAVLEKDGTITVLGMKDAKSS